MATRIILFLSSALLLCATVSAEDSAPQPKKQVKKVVPAKKVIAVKVQAVKKLTQAQQAATKKYVEARKTAIEAAKALAEAEKAAATAEGDAAKQKAAKRVNEAKQKLAEAKKAVEKQRAALSKVAAAQAVAIRGRYAGRANLAVREKVDPQDSVERFAVLTTGGPLVVEVSMTLDGKPFRVAREKLLDEMLATADTDKDGKVTWPEAIKNPKFTSGRLYIRNEQQQQQYVKMFDANKNNQVDRAEARRFVAQFFGGPAFTLSGASGYWSRGGGGAVVLTASGRAYSRGGQADVKKLLDTDKDGVLSEKEIAAAGDRLKSRDADGNDLLLPSEVNGGTAPRANNRRVVRLGGMRSRVQLGLLLGPTAKADALFKALQQKYKNDAGEIAAVSFRVVPKLFEQLDKNDNGKLEQDEVLALNDVKPHITLAAGFGKTDGAKGLSLKGIASELKKTNASSEAISVELPGIKLACVANLTPPRTYDYARTAKTYLTRYDKNNNGYLEKKEVPQNFLARQFGVWDANSDGKVYPKEITAAFNRQQAPQKTQIRGSVSSQGNSLFQALDFSGDNRLSLREMKTAHKQLKSFDKNKDGKISQQEIPVTVSVNFSQGGAAYQFSRQRPGAQPARKAAATGAPDWFTRMDRNGDGDLTLKEFLGTKDEFKKLDTNGDGFIEPKEAKAAKLPSKSDTKKKEKKS